MKLISILTLSILFLTATVVFSEVGGHEHEHGDDHEHVHVKKMPGPNGGRLITSIEPQAEFFVTQDRKVQISFLDKEGQLVAPAEQLVTVITGERSEPVTLTFAKVGDVLLSEQDLPKGNNLPVVVKIKIQPDAKASYEKFMLNFSVCGSCDLAEYACICGH